MGYQQNELLNAHGPFDHGLWSELTNNPELKLRSSLVSGGIFHERSRKLVKQITEIIASRYSKEELSQMTILDVGCYDGWIITQVAENLNFKSAVGVEPRIKNIQKGQFARTFFNIETEVVFLQGEIESLDSLFPNTKFDVVLCLGTLHHVGSTLSSIKSLTSHCADLLIIDSMVIDEPIKEASSIQRLLNLRDIAYIDSPPDWAIAAFKFETPYFDGSTSASPIVNVPEERLIRMSLKSSGYRIEETSQLEKVAYQRKFQKLRGVKESLLVARRNVNQEVNSLQESHNAKATKYESQFIFGRIPNEVLRFWAITQCQKDEIISGLDQSTSCYSKFRSKLIFYSSRKPTSQISKFFIRHCNFEPGSRDILINLSRSPFEKTRFEVGKYFLIHEDYSGAKSLFQEITNHFGADWRAFYRSCFLLAVIATIENDQESQNNYINILNIANPEFPIKIEDGVKWALSHL